MSETDYSDGEVDAEDDIPSYETVRNMSSKDRRCIDPADFIRMDSNTLHFLRERSNKLTRKQRTTLEYLHEMERNSLRQRAEDRAEGRAEGIASTREPVETALQKYLFSNITCTKDKLTAPTPSAWALSFTSCYFWGDFDDEVINDPGFQDSGVLEEFIAKAIFEPLKNFDIRESADAAKIAFYSKVCLPIQNVGVQVDKFDEFVIESEEPIGLTLKSDINLLALEDENGEQVRRVFCVIEAKRPNQLLTEHGGVANQTVESRRRRAPNNGMHNNSSRRPQTLDGLCQLLGYMVIYGLKYGVLTSFELTYFCKRNEKGEIWVSKGFYGIQNGGDISVNYAMTAFIYKILHDNDRRLPYPSMDSESVGVRSFYKMCQDSWGGKRGGKRNTLEILEDKIGSACADFIRSTIASAANQAGQEDEIEALRNKVASFLPLSEKAFSMPLPWEEDFKRVAEGVVRIPWISYKGFTWNVFVKAMPTPKDWPRWLLAESKESFLKEVELYKGPLYKLQGLYIPFLVYGGVFHKKVIIATTSSGVTATEELVITHRDWAPRSIRESLARVHQAGVSHGDIAWRNIALNLESKTAHLIDFGRATQHKDPKEFAKLQTQDKEALEDLLSCVRTRKRLRDSFRAFKQALGVDKKVNEQYANKGVAKQNFDEGPQLERNRTGHSSIQS